MIKRSDFTQLAKNYDSYRPDYSKNVLNQIIKSLNYTIETIDFADIGAGTGIWTRMVNELNPKSIKAVEPNDSMRNFGKKYKNKIEWIKGTAESTGLNDISLHWITMASSFHWADFDKAIIEFNRILKNNGNLTLLWNPRIIEENSIFKDIEDYIIKLKPDMKRQSSGLSGITSELENKISESNLFHKIKYIEGKHTILMSKERYIGAWESVNDVQYQLGEKFEDLIDFIKKSIKKNNLEISYLTRSWTMTKK